MLDSYLARLTLAAVLLTGAALAAPLDLAAQSLGGTPTFVAIPDVYPPVEGPVAVLRESGRNVILLRDSDATPEALGVALVLLRRLTERRPLQPGLSHLAPVTGFRLRRGLDADRLARLDQVLARLRQRPVARIGNLGTGRFLALAEADR